ncbi:MAG: tetratricopeptide repeat protein [bacterium]|nr:tetratricopeptide repeat protein [bacterium]
MKRSSILLLIPIFLAFSGSAVEQKSKGAVVTNSEMSADSLLALADDIFQTRDYQKALTSYLDVVKVAGKEFNYSVEAEALSQCARMNLLLGNKEEGRTFLEKAGLKARESDPYGWSRYLGVRGRFEWRDDDLTTARRTFDQMYEYCTVNSLWGRAVDAAHMIAIVANDPNEQIEWGKKGIEAAEANEIESWLGPLWNNLAGTYYDIKDFENALECYLKARKYHWRFSGEMGKLFADYHVGMTYRYLGQYDESKKWLRPVLAWAERLENHSAIGQACEDLGECEIGTGNKAGGIELLKRARSEYVKAGFDKSWPDLIQNIDKRLTGLGG